MRSFKSVLFSAIITFIVLIGIMIYAAAETTKPTREMPDITLNVGQALTMTEVFSPYYGDNPVEQVISSSPAIVKVEADRIVGVSPGTARIKAVLSNMYLVAECVVTQEQTTEIVPEETQPVSNTSQATQYIATTEIRLGRDTVEIKEGESYILSATVLPSNATNKRVIWSSSNVGVVTVEEGKITGKTVGTAIITAKTGDGNGKICTVKVVGDQEEDDSETSALIQQLKEKVIGFLTSAKADGADEIYKIPDSMVRIIKAAKNTELRNRAIASFVRTMESITYVLSRYKTEKQQEIINRFTDYANQVYQLANPENQERIKELIRKLAKASAGAINFSKEAVTGQAEISADQGKLVINAENLRQAIEELRKTNTEDDQKLRKLHVQAVNMQQADEIQAEITAQVLDTLEQNDIDILSVNLGKAKVEVTPYIKEVAVGKQQSEKLKVTFKANGLDSQAKEEVLEKAPGEARVFKEIPVLDLNAAVVDAETGSSSMLNQDLGEGVNVVVPMDSIDMTQMGSEVDTDKLTAAVYIEDVNQLENPKNTDMLNTWQPVGGKYYADAGSFKFKRRWFSMYTIMQINKSFDDLTGFEWARRDIELMASKGVVTGRTTSDFDPSARVTRAEFAALVVRTLGLLDKSASVSFNDVNTGDWYYTAVASAYQAGIVTGRSNNVFEPKAPISRQEMMKMTANAMEKGLGMAPPNSSQASSILNAFSDRNKIAQWAREAAAFSIREEIIKGRTASTINPDEYATRAETAVIAKRLYDLL